jgi:hypothetical protein
VRQRMLVRGTTKDIVIVVLMAFVFYSSVVYFAVTHQVPVETRSPTEQLTNRIRYVKKDGKCYAMLTTPYAVSITHIPCD